MLLLVCFDFITCREVPSVDWDSVWHSFLGNHAFFCYLFLWVSKPFLTKKYLCKAKGKKLRQIEDEIGRFSNHVEFCLILANFDQPMFWKGQANFLKLSIFSSFGDFFKFWTLLKVFYVLKRGCKMQVPILVCLE